MASGKLNEMYQIIGAMYDNRPKYRIVNESFYFRFGEVTSWYTGHKANRMILLDFKVRKDEKIFKIGAGRIAKELMKGIMKDIRKTLKLYQVSTNHVDRLTLYIDLGYEVSDLPKSNSKPSYNNGKSIRPPRR